MHIVREDKGEDILIYINEDRNSYIIAHPNGINGVVIGYIFFKPDGIDVMAIDGTFRIVGKNRSLRLVDLVTSNAMHIDAKEYNLKNNGSLMQLDMYVSRELIVNPTIYSKVKSVYDTALLHLESQ